MSPKDEAIRDFGVIAAGRPRCSRCGEPMLEIQPCHYQCKTCGGVHDCNDIASGG